MNKRLIQIGRKFCGSIDDCMQSSQMNERKRSSQRKYTAATVTVTVTIITCAFTFSHIHYHEPTTTTKKREKKMNENEKKFFAHTNLCLYSMCI